MVSYSPRSQPQGFTRHVARGAAETAYADLPDDVIELACDCVLDIVGVAIAASGSPLLGPVLELLRAEGGIEQATLLGIPSRSTVRGAALFNGTAAHLLDYDDVHTAMQGHPSAPMIPAILALAEERDATGRDLIAAIVAGYEAQARIGAAFGRAHYEAGFHATGTLGTFGAAAGCARLLGLSETATAHALGLAATQAAGLKCMFGTFGKPFHAGKAAENGLLAALLAANGMTCRIDALESAQGFAFTHSPAFTPEAGIATPSNGFHIRDALFKFHASCFDTHAAIENARALMAEHRFERSQVAGIEVFVDRNENEVCNIHSPASGLECKFSLRMTTAMSLAGLDTSDPGIFTDELVNNAEVRGWCDLVTVDASGNLPPSYARTVVRLNSGAVLAAEDNPDSPQTDLARQRSRLLGKFRALIAPKFGDEGAANLAHSILELPSTPVRTLTALAARPSSHGAEQLAPAVA